ncbi:EAL domain-containing protein [Asticcacaulis sp. EMRT-3]|uniref:EAL domain-containing protein n=1 Tax=Asticcacaulis sp. EMRT-3 TaxID=3040349 RepID=UPI0024AEE895|nr:EAL domain-containing protein [Asticcacaulis sp. EMRT-3]MDI7776091.1 EAL domain-containing protein [Asticcacaulis sp. EMRT-3]
MTEDLKHQRDRYIAFSLAAADLLIEVDRNFRIVRTIGATQALLSGVAAEVVGRDVCQVFTIADRHFARRLLERVITAGRIEPCALHLDQKDQPPLLVNLGACHLSGQDGHSFLSLTVLSDAVVINSDGRDPVSGLFDSATFEAFAEKTLQRGGPAMPGSMKMVRVSGLSRAIREMPAAKASMLVSEIGAVLRAQSLSGMAAARLSEEDFSYLPSPAGAAASPEVLSHDIDAAARAAGLPAGSLKTSVMNLELSVGNLDPDSIARALNYVLSDFCRPERSPISDLEGGLQAAMAATVGQFDSIKSLIDSGTYTLYYQPVVQLCDRSVHHYEGLLRFADGRSPFDTIRMSEQLGLVQDFDLAVAKKAVDMLNLRSDIKVAINLSGQSVQNDLFRENLRLLLLPFPQLSTRLLFELTESSAIDDMETAGNFLRWLRRTGYQVCLDDFGSGAATYAYLRRFDVDFVKIDGPFLMEARDNPRQRALIRSVVSLARELRSETVAEMVEDEDMARLCQDMGITFGQGYHFGKPKPQIEAPKELIVGKRKGFSESWG